MLRAGSFYLSLESVSVIVMERRSTEIFEQKRLAELMERLFDHQKFLRDERKMLWQIEKESEEQYTVLDRLEVLSMFIVGYVSQITTKGYTRQEPQGVISHLHRLSIFNRLLAN